MPRKVSCNGHRILNRALINGLMGLRGKTIIIKKQLVALTQTAYPHPKRIN